MILRCLRTILVHKWWVLVVGLRLQVPLWRLLIHDASKLQRVEFMQYAKVFHGGRTKGPDWDAAWLHHLHNNPHHWQHWVKWDGKPLPMPWWAVREMVADWMAAGKVYVGQWPDPHNWVWLKRHKPTFVMHPLTKQRLDVVVAELQARSNGK